MSYAYGTSKLAVERMLRDVDGTYGARVVSLKYFIAACVDPDREPAAARRVWAGTCTPP